MIAGVEKRDMGLTKGEAMRVRGIERMAGRAEKLKATEGVEAMSTGNRLIGSIPLMPVGGFSGQPRRAMVWAALLAVLAFVSVAEAEDDKTEAEQNVTKLKEVVVSAPKADRTLVDVPASITIITADEIVEMGATNIVDVIKSIPGVVMDSDSRDRVTIRGNRGPQSSGVLVLVDGVPVNSGISGYPEYDAIPLSDIERIEVRRSSGSIVFGPDAARGVVNVITKKAKKEGTPRVQLSASGGSWGTWKESISVSGRASEWDYGFSGSRMDTDGYEDDEKELAAGRIGLGYNFSEQTRLGLNLSWRDCEYDTIYGKTQWQVDNYRDDSVFPTSATNPTLVHPREDSDENLSVSLDFKHESEDTFVDAFVSYDNTDHLYDYLPKELDAGANKTSSSYDYREDRDESRLLGRASVGHHFHLGSVDYTAVVGGDYENTEFDQKKSYPWSPTPLSAAQITAVAKGTLDTERERWGIFLTNEVDLDEHWELNVNGRVDRVAYDVKNMEPKDITTSDTDVSWEITPAFHPSPDSTVYVSVSRSFWYPVLQYYKYAMESGGVQNSAEDLESEKYLSCELGYKHALSSRLNLACTAYCTKVEDKFLSYYDNATWKGYANVGTSIHKGVEVEASGNVCPHVNYRLGAACQDAEWDDATFRAYVWGNTPAGDAQQNVDISGEKVPHVPQFTGKVGLDFFFLEYFKFSTDLNYSGKQYVDVLNRSEINGYATVDLRLSYTRDRYRIWVLANNVFDREEENLFNETGQRNADGSLNYLCYPLDGRYLEAGVAFTF